MTEEQKQKANETTAVLIPIAHRLGINTIKSELEELCFKFLKSDIYDDIESELEKQEIYNLRGERIINVDRLDRGIYIINGKKVFVK